MQVPCIKGPKTRIKFRGTLKIHLDDSREILPYTCILALKTKAPFIETLETHFDDSN